jgi:uncharacterized protein YdeI (BOF family)
MQRTRVDEPRCGGADPFLSMRAALLCLLGAASGAEAQIDVEEKAYAYPDDAFITLNGTVTAVSRDTFVLDFGGGEIVVEVDSAEGVPEAVPLTSGEAVRVTGIVDEGFFERRTIEATGVLRETGETIYASPVDEEDTRSRGILESPRTPGPTETVVTGRVSEIDDRGREFTLASGSRHIEVELSVGARVDLDESESAAGRAAVEVGDSVRVIGRIDEEFFGDAELVADTVLIESR